MLLSREPNEGCKLVHYAGVKSGRRVLPAICSTRYRLFLKHGASSVLILRFFLSPTFWFSPFTGLKQNHLLAANWIFAIVNRRIPDARLYCQRLALPNSATDRGVGAALIYLPQRSLFTLRLYRINVSISHPVCFGYKFSITALLLHGEFIIRGVPHMWCLYLDVRAPSNFKCIPDCAVRVWSQEKPWRHKTLLTVPDCFDKYRTGSDRDLREKGGQNKNKTKKGRGGRREEQHVKK